MTKQIVTQASTQEEAEPAFILIFPPDEEECAWCNQEAGETQGNTSNGICKDHSQQLYASLQAKRAERRAAR